MDYSFDKFPHRYDPFTIFHKDINYAPTDIPRDIDGRRWGQGQWLESLTREYLEERGYWVMTNVDLFSPLTSCPTTETFEVDLVAYHEPTNRTYIIQCKDWHSTTIYESVITRLYMLADLCNAIPVLAHSTELNSGAEQLARFGDIRELTLHRILRNDPARDDFKHLRQLQYQDRDRTLFTWSPDLPSTRQIRRNNY